MRSVIVLILGTSLCLASCDKQSAPVAQGSAKPSEQSSAQALPQAVPTPDAKRIADKAHAQGLPAPDEQGVLVYDHKGQPLPTADFLGLGGKGMTLAIFKGRPLLLNLWATWCAPCVAEMPKLDALAQQQADKLQVVTISQDLRGKELVAPWWAAHKPVLLQPYTDPELHMLAALNGGDVGAGSLPTTVLYDKNGKEVWRMMGAMDWTGPRAKELLAEGM